MRLPVPTPQDLGQMFTVVPRMMGLLDSTAQILERIGALITRIEGTREQADAVLKETQGVVDRASVLIVRTAGVVGSVEPTLDRAVRLLDAFEPSIVKLRPALERLAETTHAEEIDALIELIDNLPGLAHQMETTVLPALKSLDSVAPDVHDLLDMAREANAMMAKIPGLGRTKRNIDEN